jgi:hypothetical protein
MVNNLQWHLAMTAIKLFGMQPVVIFFHVDQSLGFTSSSLW